MAIKFPHDRRIGVLAFGDPNIDLVFSMEKPPQTDQKLLGRRVGSYAGGTVANVACAAALLGCSASSFGRVGGDSDGRFLVEEFSRFGVGIEYVRTVPDKPSSTALLMVDANGEKACVYAPMPGKVLEPAILASALATSQLLYAAPYDQDEFEQAHNLARAAEVAVAIDVEVAMVPDRSHLQRLLGLCDIVFMNHVTFFEVFGVAAEPRTIPQLLEHGASLAVVTCGARGALAATRSAYYFQEGFPATVVDSTGAGDTFNGAFLAALMEGRPIDAALRFACAAGSLAVRAFGARASMPGRQDIAKLLAQSTSGAAASTK